MERRRKKRHAMTTAAELRVVRSVICHRIIAVMERTGPCSVGKLAHAMHRRADGLYFHVRKLVEIGLVRHVGHHRPATRPEAVYDLVADHIVVDPNVRTPGFLRALAAMYATSIRVAAERTRAAALQTGNVRAGRGRSLMVKRFQVSLGADALAELNERLDELSDFLRAQENTGERLYSVSLLLTPAG